MKNKNLLVIIGAVFTGLLSTLSPGSIFNIILFLFLILLIYFKSHPEDRNFLTTIFISGIFIRVLLLLLITFILTLNAKWYTSKGDMLIAIFGDSGYYTLRSWWIVQFLLGKPLNDEVLYELSIPYGDSGHLYPMALFHYLFGFSPISVTFINCIFSVLTGIFSYLVAKEIAGIRQAKITAILVVFFPSLVIWSITNLKDPIFIFLTNIIFWLFLKFIKTNKFRYLILLILVSKLQFYIRPVFIFPIILWAIFGLSYLIIKKKYTLIILLLIILIIKLPIAKLYLDNFKSKTIERHRGIVSTGGFVYRIYDDWVYGNIDIKQVGYFEFLRGLFKGWLHSFLEPFPWKMSSKLSLMSLPQMIIWYPLLLFSFLGVLIQLKNNWRKSFVFIVYFFIIGSALSLAQGNVGTVFRIRDMFTPIILLFSSIGLSRTLFSKDQIPVQAQI